VGRCWRIKTGRCADAAPCARCKTLLDRSRLEQTRQHCGVYIAACSVHWWLLCKLRGLGFAPGILGFAAANGIRVEQWRGLKAHKCLFARVCSVSCDELVRTAAMLLDNKLAEIKSVRHRKAARVYNRSPLLDSRLCLHTPRTATNQNLHGAHQLAEAATAHHATSAVYRRSELKRRQQSDGGLVLNMFWHARTGTLPPAGAGPSSLNRRRNGASGDSGLDWLTAKKPGSKCILLLPAARRLECWAVADKAFKLDELRGLPAGCVGCRPST
jgi:hypothetical protein